MAVTFLNRNVSDLCVGKPALKPLSAAATVSVALSVLNKSGEPHVSVWSSDHSKKVLEGECECRCIGKICMVDVICFLCKHENLDNPSKALEKSVSHILAKGNFIVRHLAPNSRLVKMLFSLFCNFLNLTFHLTTRD